MHYPVTYYPVTIEKKILQAFSANGFVVTPEVLSPEEVKRFGAAVDSEVKRRTAGDIRSIDEKSTYEKSFVQCMRLWETSELVRELSLHQGLAGIASQLLNEPEILLWQDQALYKEPGGRMTDAHQDQPFWPIGNAPLVSAWIPFDDVTIDSGAMAYVPGSHAVGKLKVVDITHNTDPYNILADPALNGVMPESVEVLAGSVIWHHGFTVHLAHANKSGKVRRVFTNVYLAKGYRREKPWPVFPLDRAGVGVGELMQGAGLPLVWPGNEDVRVPEQVGQAIGPQY